MRFTNNRFDALANRLARLKGVYEKLQTDLLVQVNDIAATFFEVFEEATSLVTEIDVLCSFALASVQAPIPYKRPTVHSTDLGKLYVSGGRHPLVEAQGECKFAKNDCDMILGRSWFQFITGPTMGGKSTSIKQVKRRLVKVQRLDSWCLGGEYCFYGSNWMLCSLRFCRDCCQRCNFCKGRCRGC